MRTLRAFAAAAILVASPFSAAQEPAPPAPAAAPAEPAAPPAPTPIAAPEVVTRAEETKGRLKQMEARIAPDAVELDVTAKLPELEAKVAERVPRAEALLGDAVSLEALSDLSGEWSARADRLTEWRHGLTRRALAIEAELQLLAEEEAVWKATQAAGAGGAFPATTLDYVRETLDAINDTEKAVKKRRTQILSLQNDVAQQELMVSSVLDRVETRGTELRSQIFRADAPPLWSPEAFRAPDAGLAFGERMREALRTGLSELDDFRSRSGGPLAFAFGCFLAVLVALGLGRDRMAKTAQADPTFAPTARIFARPFSAALVVAIVASSMLYKRMPGVAADLQSLVLLVPMMRILPAELWAGFRPGLLVLATLFATGSMRAMFNFSPGLDRLLLLAESLVGAGLFLWLMRPEKATALDEIGRFAGAVRPVAAIALLLLVAAALLNVVGRVSAGRVTLRGTLSSAYVAVALYAAARILAGVLTAALRSDLARKLRSVRDYGALVRGRTLTAVYWSLALFWAWATLRLFRISDDVLGAAGSVLKAKLEVGTVSVSLGDVVAFGLTLWFASLLARFLRFALESDVLPHLALPRGVPNAISTTLQYAILLVGFTLALGAAGIDLTRFTLLAGAFGVGIGFGLQVVVNNFVSGLILLFERPVQIGDVIDVGGIAGEVVRIGIRSSTLHTAEGADVIVPNATLISDRVVNWTLSDRHRRIEINVGVKYGTDPEKVIALLVATARGHAEVLTLPEPVALFLRFGDSSLDFQLLCWTRFDIAVRVKSELSVALHAALVAAGMEVPFPQRELHVKVEPGTPTYILPETVGDK